jgi:uncharacterized membrane protein
MNRILLILWLLTLATLVWLGVGSYTSLPDTMVSSFDAAGQPKGESGKGDFFLIWYFAVVLINVFVPLIPWLARVRPALVSVPNKEYWLATPERREEFSSRMANFTLVLTILLNLLFCLILQGTIDVNLEGRTTLPVGLIWGTIVLLLIMPLVMIFQMFRVPKEG